MARQSPRATTSPRPPPKSSLPTASPTGDLPAKTPIRPSKSAPRVPKVILLLSFVFITTVSYTGANIYNVYKAPPPTPEEIAAAEAANLIEVYDRNATEFDEEVNSLEYWNGTMRLRRKLVKQARGDVLESAAGTGRNGEFYIAENIRSLTLIDASKPMLTICRKKWVEAHPFSLAGPDPEKKQEIKAAKKDPWTPSKPVQFLIYNLERSSIIPPTHPRRGPGYDTIIQTMGLCSTSQPNTLLSSLSSLLRPGGRILLLEHGKSHYEWLNVVLTKSAPGHAARFGCWWNKDIGKICADSGLEVVEIRRPGWWNLGTLWWVELRKPATATMVKVEEAVHDGEKSDIQTKPERTQGWSTWWQGL
ncbi:RNA polymerase II transcription factor B subunit 2 [Venturia nashicola]|uniref:RNA polymerase II transcription factor B subunit 2 n=1 Tax=Venturia nashicola TaxID=86259 RepID=A0A4Z1PQ98_9PEZI|nr:RNA polymerase II transcription factor B subunit 2 [Venturia nashicola]TLD37131.1 RNA polymerase II transcription factor B subunit 2 [Venturia nashicola]